MIRKLDWYILRKFVVTFLFMVLLLILVTVVIDFAEKLDEFIEFDTPASAVLTDYYPNFIIWITNLLSPICVFLAAIFFTSRMAQNTEIIAILSSGVSFYRLFVPYLFAALLFAGLSFWLNAYAVPQAIEDRMDFEYEHIKREGRFEQRNIHKKVGPALYVYMQRYNQFRKTAYQFALERFNEEGKLVSKLWANKAQYNDSLAVWQLKTVEIRHFPPLAKQHEQRAALDTAIKLTPTDIYQRKNFVQSLTLSELTRYIARERERGSDLIHDLMIEKYARSAYPFASIVLTLIAFALSTQKRRGGIALQIGLGFIICFIFIFVLNTFQVAFGRSLPAWLAVWFPNMLFSLIGLFLLWRAPK